MTKKKPNKATRELMSRMVDDGCIVCGEPTTKDFCEFHQKACEVIGRRGFYKAWGIDEQEMPTSE